MTRIRRGFSRSTTYPTPKGGRDCSMLLKRPEDERVVALGPQDLHDMVKATLPEVQFPAVSAYPTGRTRDDGCSSVPDYVSRLRHLLRRGHLSSRGERNERTTYLVLSRLSMTERGMAYGRKRLWSRTSHSSQRQGKPGTGRRGGGFLIASIERRSTQCNDQRPYLQY